jgi:hypothetical protein
VADKAVLGLASGYTETHIAPFLRSLRETGYDGAVVLLVDDVSIAAMRDAPLLEDVQLVRVNTLRSPRQPTLRRLARSTSLWPLLAAGGWLRVWFAGRGSQSPADRARQRAVAGRALHPMLARHFFYRQVLDNANIGQVMLTDVRDVLFQTDPFDFLTGDELCVGLHKDTLTIGDELYNKVWVRSGFGRAMLERIGDRHIACAGIVVGSGDAATKYLHLMTEAILDLPPQGIVPFGTDQGVHNVLVWTESLEDVRLIPTLEGEIATLEGFSLGELRFDARGRLVNRDGSLVNIVHQYDRVPGLSDQLLTALDLGEQ